MENTEQGNVKLEKFIEFESKYRVDGDRIYLFKEIVEALPDQSSFLYIQGPDYYFVRDDERFARYRKADNDKSGRAEVTFKLKPVGAKSNIQRKEYNWRVDKTPYQEIAEGLEDQGYKFNFKITKFCHIYKFEEATLVFYSVRDDKGKLDHFIEIELDEESIHTLTITQAMEKIRKYEAILAPLGISHRNRLTKSLYEMYVKDTKNEKIP
jgi:adenylate cyclase class IV